MRALVWTGPDRLELQERPPRPPGPREALVRVKAAGISATDLQLMNGRLPFAKPPKVLGHEIAGVVEASPVKEWIDRRVIVNPVTGCGRCAHCKADRKVLCDKAGKLGTTGGDGGYAEYVTVPVANLLPLPDSLSFEAGALVEPLECTLGAFERAQVRPGETVLVFGSGPAGLLFVQLARSRECRLIMLVGGGKAKLAAGAALGATYAWSHENSFLQDLVLSYTSGDGPDLAIEASGADPAVSQAFSWVRKGGRVVLFGLSGSFGKNIPSDTIVTKDLSVGSGIGSPDHWARAIELASTGKVDVASLVTHRFPLDQADLAVAAARDLDASIQVVLTP
jgi:threonine dehydrogenase-like Zn-dependent dehydrogenase